MKAIYEPEAAGAYWRVLAKIRGKNAFGGGILKVARFYMQGDEVVFMQE